jgi:hypothetical protein
MADAATSTNLKDQAASTSPALAKTLPTEAVFDALRMILIGAPFTEVLTTVTRLIEAHSAGMMCSIFLLDEDSLHLRYGVAASLPEAYWAATDGLFIGPNVGSCGTAAYLRQPVFVSDIASDPRWVKYRDFALQNGLRAAWSTPIMSHDGKVLGTFCMYYREVRHPGPDEIQLIDYATRTCLHPDQGSLHVGGEGDELLPGKLLPQQHLARCAESYQVKRRLAKRRTVSLRGFGNFKRTHLKGDCESRPVRMLYC